MLQKAEAASKKITVKGINYKTGLLVFTANGRTETVNVLSTFQSFSIKGTGSFHVEVKVIRPLGGGLKVDMVHLEAYDLLPGNVRKQTDIKIIQWQNA